jgi:hypothetical protein
MKLSDARRILSKLQKLRSLADLAPGEEKSEARVNEARASALLMLKIAKDNGFVVRFEIPGEISEEHPMRAGETRVEHSRPAPQPKKEEPFPWENDQGYERYSPPAGSAYAQGFEEIFSSRPQGPFRKVDASGASTDEFGGAEDTVGRRDGPNGKGQHCSACGKPIATRTWYAPGQGCTHVNSSADNWQRRR